MVINSISVTLSWNFVLWNFQLKIVFKPAKDQLSMSDYRLVAVWKKILSEILPLGYFNSILPHTMYYLNVNLPKLARVKQRRAIRCVLHSISIINVIRPNLRTNFYSIYHAQFLFHFLLCSGPMLAISPCKKCLVYI